ncbi:MAG: hypothetical protein SFU85_11590 [Candidatus Methylacidiphilales bacterium]|nr:hypothetical protein [Candidatus Methylacidiphilales bacterium]
MDRTRQLGWAAVTALVAVAIWISLIMGTANGLDVARWPALPFGHLPWLAQPNFYDEMALLHMADAVRDGRDPYGDARGQSGPYLNNYPSIWAGIRHLGLGVEDARPFGLALAALYLVAWMVCFRPFQAAQTVWCLAFLLSPPSLNAMASANNEIVIFALMVAAGHFAARSRGASTALVVLAALLKIIPFAALPVLVDGKRRTLLWVAAGLVICTAWFACHKGELQQLNRSTPRPNICAFGSGVLGSRLSQSLSANPEESNALPRHGHFQSPSWCHGLYQFLLVAGFLGPLLFGLQGLRRGWNAPPTPDDPNRVLFRMGTMLYLTAFALGHNWPHRLILLYLAVPWLASHKSLRWLAALVLAVGYLVNSMEGQVFLAVQVATWMLALRLAFELGRSLAPDIAASYRALGLAPAWKAQTPPHTPAV